MRQVSIRGFKIVFFIPLFLLSISCGDGDTTDNPSDPTFFCDLGATQTCICLSGGSGVQQCVQTADKGTKWGECLNCTTVVGQDNVSDSSDDSATLGECEYSTCAGDICTDVEGCCETSACNSWYYYDPNEFSETYCYPMCDTSAVEPCKCGDVCVDIDSLPLCLKFGAFSMNNLSIPVGEDYDAAVSTPTTDMQFTAMLGDTPITLEYVSANWNTWEDSTGTIQRSLDVWFDGMAGGLSIWILAITIMEETFNRGPGTYKYYDDDADETLNFYAELYLGNMDRSTSLISELWLETIPDPEPSTLTINQTCEACPIGGTNCAPCSFSFTLSWLALRAKLALE